MLVTMLKKKFVTQDTDAKDSDAKDSCCVEFFVGSAEEDHDVHDSKDEQLPSMGSFTTSPGCVETLTAVPAPPFVISI